MTVTVTAQHSPIIGLEAIDHSVLRVGGGFNIAS